MVCSINSNAPRLRRGAFICISSPLKIRGEVRIPGAPQDLLRLYSIQKGYCFCKKGPCQTGVL